jgi:8-oxo-dGTP pyrophosphatase MutT (NUDIX family)
MSDELVTIVDENNVVTGSMPRSQMRASGLPHRACYVLVLNAQGEVFVQKRTTSKDVYPGYFDLVAGGVVLANESFDESASRETAEELGITGAALTPLFPFAWRDSSNAVFGKAYECQWEGPMVLQPEEVESGRFQTPAQIAELAKTGTITPDSLYVFARYLRDKGREEHRMFERWCP